MVVDQIKNKRKPKATGRIFTLVLLLGLFCLAAYYLVPQGVRPLVRAVENKIVLYKTRNFSKTETDNFIFRYENIDRDTLDLIKTTAEDKYLEAAGIFKYKLKDKVLVVIYEDMDLMMSTTMLRKGKPPVGVYYGNTIHIPDPKVWIKDTSKLEYTFYNEGPMLHELVHLFTDHLGNGNFPMWFTEGVSLYFEYIVDGYEWGSEVDENIYTIRELNDSFNSLNQYEAYTMSFRLVKNMVDEHGLDKLIDLIALLGRGHSIDDFLYLFEKFNI